ncbi:transcriptional regulator SplA domain-containing protein [Salibacterium qingdaonense]|uniref:Transcriptional regulator of the spore photoproduct lyase operon n=1 Tax=Salibacterium qingdaonense TaxID=266892 RepID=A0A1I4KIM1_9BACI|nr:transcriptional regulator SplA domain-containing protein [Salibacterium qingdaonense]SFL78366.1 transcriptional regulator of the spore photoproduct lyase operon [Salibacterium qingdaonense]
MSVFKSDKPGDIVYVMIRNPHVQGVANVQEAAVVENPEAPGELALFLYETYYPLNEDIAVYGTMEEAQQDYIEAFGTPEDTTYYG